MKTLLTVLLLLIANTCFSEEPHGIDWEAPGMPVSKLSPTVPGKKPPCTATENTPCVKRSGISWCYKEVETWEECCKEGEGCLVIIKDPSRRLTEDNIYCITLRQGEGSLKLVVRANSKTPGEIVTDMFCSEGDE